VPAGGPASTTARASRARLRTCLLRRISCPSEPRCSRVAPGGRRGPAGRAKRGPLSASSRHLCDEKSRSGRALMTTVRSDCSTPLAAALGVVPLSWIERTALPAVARLADAAVQPRASARTKGQATPPAAAARTMGQATPQRAAGRPRHAMARHWHGQADPRRPRAPSRARGGVHRVRHDAANCERRERSRGTGNGSGC
jgi:hypothetical protein